ncbi:MAG TPA: hypothetical protein VMA86_09230, partial [Acetobacteraceae bacterium]|nr:hypothetical protein [Acetobacteraceae bacterium]
LPLSRRGGAEHLLFEAAQRALRAPEEWLALVLHLGRLVPPAPQPHHRRVARALLHEAAERNDGQLFPLANGDLVLLCRRPHNFVGTAPRADDPLRLPQALAALFCAATTDPGGIVSLWRLAEHAKPFLAYAAERRDAAAALGSEAAAGDPPPVLLAPAPEPRMDGLAALAAAPGFAELVQRQTAALVVRAAGGRPPRLRPLFRELGFRLPALAARFPPAREARADPWLFRHLAAHLDQRMLALLEAALPSAGPLALRGAPGGVALHLNLTLATILGPAFDRFIALCRALGVTIGAEIALIEAVADAASFARARAILREAGFRLVLDGVTHLALPLCRPEALGPDLLKLEWSERLATLAPVEKHAFAAALDALGPERVVLQRADGENAVLWGIAHGIRRFQGRHVDVMLGAARIASCPAAGGCTLSQCAERAGAATAAGRRACRNLALLDQAAPAESQGESQGESQA